MKVSKQRILPIAFACIVAGTTFFLTIENDPLYHAKHLSRHLRDINPQRTNIFGNDYFPCISIGSSNGEPWEAIRAVGTNALPMIVRMLCTRNSSLRIRCYEVLDGYPRLQMLIGSRRDVPPASKGRSRGPL